MPEDEQKASTKEDIQNEEQSEKDGGENRLARIINAARTGSHEDSAEEPAHPPPFAEADLGEELGRGIQSIATEIGPDSVLKEVNREFLEQNGLGKLADHFESEDYLRNASQDHRQLKEIFGDQLLDTVYIRGHSKEDGHPTNYIFQKNGGKTWETYSAGLNSQQREIFNENNRDELIGLVYKARRAMVDFGIPIDLKGDNVLINEGEDGTTTSIVLADPGSPTDSNEILLENYDPEIVPPEIRKVILHKMVEHVDNMDSWLERFDMSDEEVSEYERRYGVSEEEFNASRNSFLEAVDNAVGLDSEKEKE